MSTALVNHELRWKDNSNSTPAEASTVKGRSSNRKGKGDCERSKSRSALKKNQCAFCKEEDAEKLIV